KTKPAFASTRGVRMPQSPMTRATSAVIGFRRPRSDWRGSKRAITTAAWSASTRWSTRRRPAGAQAPAGRGSRLRGVLGLDREREDPGADDRENGCQDGEGGALEAVADVDPQVDGVAERDQGAERQDAAQEQKRAPA